MLCLDRFGKVAEYKRFFLRLLHGISPKMATPHIFIYCLITVAFVHVAEVGECCHFIFSRSFNAFFKKKKSHRLITSAKFQAKMMLSLEDEQKNGELQHFISYNN